MKKFLNPQLKAALEFLFPGYEQGRGPSVPKVAKSTPKAGQSSKKRKRRQDSDSDDEENRDPDSPKKLTERQRRMLYNRVQAENSKK